jgi:transposase
VAKVYPELVIRDERGKIEGVRYEELAPMLLNEVQRQADEIHAMQAQIAELKALEQARQNGGGPNY